MTLIGYARCSTKKQDTEIQQKWLKDAGAERIYIDEGFTGTSRAKRQRLDVAMADVKTGDTLITPKLDRLARSVQDAGAIARELQDKGVKLQVGTKVYDPADPFDVVFFNVVAAFAQFEADLIRLRTREGMARARDLGHLHGRGQKLNPNQQAQLVKLYESGEFTIGQLAESFDVSRPTVYRVLQADRKRKAAAA
jgi:DNA invertase Pin-like site-specific DNA recombinase